MMNLPKEELVLLQRLFEGQAPFSIHLQKADDPQDAEHENAHQRNADQQPGPEARPEELQGFAPLHSSLQREATDRSFDTRQSAIVRRPATRHCDRSPPERSEGNR